ncbi:hypothetical protein L2E82_50683 [Cichorium intybus]|nr:hypothetical protein L2E82_50683 [Cichorium intybus]
MAYYSKNKTDNLVKIGEETFVLIDGIFFGGRNSRPPPSAPATAPPSRTQQQVFHHQYQPQQPYVVQQRQAYDAPIPAKRTERVINCNEAAKMYGGTLFVDYPKRKPARKGFFF